MVTMYVPDDYRDPDGSWAAELVRSHPLALLATDGVVSHGCGPFATHLPIVADPARHDRLPDDLVGATLLGHMNRANPHWAALTAGAPVLAVFTGPDGYVSPTLYDASPCAPTWDFTAVHLRGTLTPIPSGGETLEVVRATVRALEEAVGTGWDMTDSIDYFRQILPGVGAFRIEVTRAEAMFKLSQEQSPQRRARVQGAFACSGVGRHSETAKLIDRLSTTCPDRLPQMETT